MDGIAGNWVSKAAFNMATENLSTGLGQEKSSVVGIYLHLETVNSGSLKPYHRNIPVNKLLTPKFLTNCLMNIMENVDMGKMGGSIPSLLGVNTVLKGCKT